jgi:DNA-binding transcriptional ArsR family regulator
VSSPEAQRHEIADTVVVDKPEQLKALGHPLRLKVLQVLNDSDRPLTNRELAQSLAVDPGHLHFHVRMLHRAGLIELVETGGREKPYRPIAKHVKVEPEIRAKGLASELQAAQLREVQRAFDLFAAQGEFRTAQVHGKLDVEKLRAALGDLMQKLDDLEDDSQPRQTITIAFHPTIESGDPS